MAVTEQTFRDKIIELLMTIVHARTKSPARPINLLANVTLLGPDAFSEKNMLWLDEKVHRIYEMHRILKKAFIKPGDPQEFSHIVQYITLNNSKNKLQMQLFSNTEEAVQWVIS